MMFEWMATTEGWVALATLSAIEIVLGIDNVIFISLLVAKLPVEQAKKARAIGLALALVMRVALLFTLTAILALREPFGVYFGQPISWRDVILFVGGMFLIVKATHEIHATVEGPSFEENHGPAPRAFVGAMLQIAVIDLVFSIDSIVTAVGMAQDLGVMVTAVIIAMGVMYVSAGPLSAFIARHPTTKVLALAFLLLVGLALCADAFGLHIPRGYLYAAMAFAAGVEALNLLVSKNNAAAHKRRAERRKAEEVP
jgi:predicted tellurium resistance membrane protein TerC